MTQLYRHFDADGTLLYVGVSLSAVARLKQHNASAHWAASIARVDVETFDAREAALKAEAEAIRTERPLHNIKHYTPPKGRVAEAEELFGFRLVMGYLPNDTADEIEPVIHRCDQEIFGHLGVDYAPPPKP